MSRRPYDLAVIGGGAAGLTAAGSAAALGAKTVLIERARFGGECTWTGCVPSKALLRAASAAADARGAARYGIDAEPQVDGARVLARIRAVRERIYAESDAPDVLARYGVETVRAHARFVDPHTLMLDGDDPRTIAARRFVIATGSRALPLELDVPTVDPETIWDIPELPARLLIAGGGPVAVELAQAFARLGTRVTIVTAGARILERDEADAADVIARAVQTDGVEVIAGARIASASCSRGTITARISDGTAVEADLLCSAIGRAARTDGIALERAGVAVREGLVAVNDRCRTTARHIYAAGDCATTLRFTHVAERMAVVAVMNGVVGVPYRFDPAAATWTTFTDPELAHVGPTQAELRAAGRPHRVERFPFARVDRAIIDGAEEGFVTLVTSRRGRILAGTVVGPRAGEMIAEIALARKRRMRAATLAGTLHGYPTYAMGVRRAADITLIRARTGPVLAVLRTLRRLRGCAPPLDQLLP